MRTRRALYRSPEREGRENLNQALPIPARRNQVPRPSLKTNLEEIYQNIKSVPAFTSKIRDFLRENETSSVFRQVRHKFPRRRIVAHFPLQIVMSDTINYRNIAGPKNKGFKYIMVVVDVFSKFAWAEPMKRLNDFESLAVLTRILDKMPEIPTNFVTDLGKEYYNRKVYDLFRRFGINHYSLRGPHKASIAERFIRTLKSKIERYFYKNKTTKWIDILPQFIENYNKTYHRSIKMAPMSVNDDNREQVYRTLYPKLKDHIKPRLKVGDRVRILIEKNIFKKGYKRSWSLEIYRVSKVFTQGAVDFYQIEDQSGVLQSRKKYFWELNLVSRNDSRHQK